MSLIKHCISTAGASPIRQVPYRILKSYQKAMTAELKEIMYHSYHDCKEDEQL